MNKGKLYRVPNGKIMGVCGGLANWLRVDTGLVRVGFIIAASVTGGVFIFVYVALGIILPIDDYSSEGSAGSEGSESIFNKFKNDYQESRRSGRKGSDSRRRATVEDVKNEFDNLKSRVGKMEDTVFNKERDWDERFKKS
ncbi:MAG: PspC domain-containing protein [Spirochaetaceae bacterium]